MDEFIGPTRIIRTDFYHRPVSAPGEREDFNEWAEATIAEVGRAELIRRINEEVASVASDLRNGILSARFRKVVYDTAPTREESRELHRKVNRSSILLLLERRFGWSWMQKMATKKWQRQWIKYTKAQWGARWVDCSSPVYVQTGFEYYPHEGSRYPERWEPRGLSVHVTSEGSMGWRDEHGNMGTLDLYKVSDAILASLSSVSLKGLP